MTFNNALLLSSIPLGISCDSGSFYVDIPRTSGTIPAAVTGEQNE
jgi:hypothetical protein